jgi:hypothetical protein
MVNDVLIRRMRGAQIHYSEHSDSAHLMVG